MLNRLNKLSFFETFRNISTYFSAQVAIQALGLISLPVYTYFLSTEEYGIVNVYISYSLVFAILLSLNLHGAVSRYYYEEKEDFKSFMGTTFVSTFVLFFLSSLVILFFKEEISEVINLPERVIPWLLGFSFLGIIYSIYLQVFVPQKKSKLVSWTQVIMHYFKFGLIVVGLFLMTENTYMGKIKGEFIAMSLVCVFLLYKIIPYIKLTFNKEHLNYIVNYSFPLIPFILSGYILHSFDQFYINAKVGQSEAGLYSFAYKIGMLLAGFITALLNGSNPDYYKWMNASDHKAAGMQVVSLTKLLVLATAFLVLYAIDLGTLLARNDDFHEGLTIVPVIVGGYFLFGLAQFYNRGIYFKKKNIYLTVIVMIAVMINIALNFYYIPIYGYMAAAYTTLLSYLVMFAVTLFVTEVVLKLPSLPGKRIFMLSLYLILLVIIYYKFVPQNALDPVGIIFKTLLFGILAIILYGRHLKNLMQHK